MKIIWTKTAADRLAEIYDYIKIDNPINAQRWVETVLDKISKLSELPKIGRKVPEVNTESIRELIFGNYRIIYKTARENIEIVTVRHFKQILPIDEIE